MLRIFSNARIATMDAPRYGLIEGGIAIENGRITAVGPEVTDGEDLGGRLVTPGLIDCHTHLVFGGDRAAEFEMRLEGASYEELARAGGGIMSTVRATRAASEDELVQSALPRLDALIAEGVTTVEIKSGYGLTVDDEFKMLQAARRLESLRPICTERTFLGPHAIPPEYEGRGDAYINEVCIEVLKRRDEILLAEAKQPVPPPPLFTSVDAFCEGIAFSPDQVRRFFDAADTHKCGFKIHAEQLSNLGGTKMAAEFGGNMMSADHLEYLDQEGVDALASCGATAVLLPGAFYTLRETQLPPIQALRDAGVPIAIATDCNPGSSPLTSVLLAMNMACTLFRMTPEEVLTGVTRHAARALGLPDRGTIAPGQRADLAIWDVAEPAELAYRIGFNPLHRRIFGGEG